MVPIVSMHKHRLIKGADTMTALRDVALFKPFQIVTLTTRLLVGCSMI
jgi:hypothetical protein